MCNLTNIALSVGANRIVPTVSVPYPLGNPALPEADQTALRLHRVGVALDALETEITEQTVFRVTI